MRKLRVWLTTIVALLYSLTASAYDFEVDGIRYDITSFTDLTVKASSISEALTGELVIPSKVQFNGKELVVTDICNDFAISNDAISSLTVNEGVKSIGERAFKNCKNLTNINIAQTITQIGVECFYGCTSLSTFDNRGIVSLGSKSFAECGNLKEVSIENLASLTEGTFLNCTKLFDCNLPNITSIGKEAFKNCQSMAEYNITNDVESIGESAFEGCVNLSSIIIPDNVSELGEGIFTNCTALTSISIGAGISYLPWIFEGCTNLSDIRIEDSYSTLTFEYTGKQTFSTNYDGGYCKDWEYNYYPSSAMFRNKNFKNVYIGRNLTTQAYRFKEYYQSGAYSLEYYYYIPNPPFSESRIESLIIGHLVSDLRMYKYVETRVPEVFAIGVWNGAFQNCTNLDSVAIFSTATNIPENTFNGCNSIEFLEIPNTVTQIGDNAFSGCEGLKKISLGSNLKTIGNNAFNGCDSLMEINLKNQNPPTYNTGFSSRHYISAKVNIPTGSLKKYQETEPWKNFWNIYEKDEFISWFDVGDIKYSVISSNKVEIVGNSISETKDLCLKNKVEFYGKVYDVVSISDASFKNCSYLSSVQIEEGIMHIGKSAFENCGKLKTVIIPSNMQSIGIAAFKNCLSLDNVILPSSIAMLSSECFSGCESLSSISIPPSVVTFGNNVFSGCTGLRELIIEDGQEPIIFPNGAYDTATGIQKKNVNGRTIQFKIQYYKPLFSNLPIEKLYIGRNLSRDLRYTINGDGGVDYYLITSYDAPFSGLSKLKELSIGENVDVLGPNEEYIPEVDLYVTPGSFKNCSSIQIVDVKNPTPPTGVEFTDNVYSKAQAIIPKGTINAYKEADGWMNFSFLQEKLEQYNLTFKIGDEVYLIKKVTEGEKIVLPEKPVKEGYTFSGWGEVPETMPAHDVTLNGTFTVNKYLVTFKVDGEIVYSESLEYGASIVAPDAPEKEGHTFNGWGEVDTTVPAHDVTYEANYSVNSYQLTYVVDGETVQTESVAYGTAITLIDEPVKEGYTFSGWGEVPETMPAHDVTLNGTFTINKYLVTFTVDGAVIASDSLEYGTAITVPTMPEREGYTFSGWSEVAETVPAHNVTYDASYTANIYKVYYFVGATLVHTAEVAYGEAIPEYVYEPTTEGDVFIGWIGESYDTMPAHDVTYTANITNDVLQLTIDNSQLTIYDLSGRKIEVDDLRELEKGVYVINGRKVVINNK